MSARNTAIKLILVRKIELNKWSWLLTWRDKAWPSRLAVLRITHSCGLGINVSDFCSKTAWLCIAGVIVIGATDPADVSHWDASATAATCANPATVSTNLAIRSAIRYADLLITHHMKRSSTGKLTLVDSSNYQLKEVQPQQLANTIHLRFINIIK